MEGSPSPPPGWYADPAGGTAKRYWDGAAWTASTAAPPTAGASPSTLDSSRGWAVAAHVSALAAFVIGFNFVGPLIVYMIKRDDDPFVRDQAAEALNFNLSFFIYAVVGTAVTLILVLALIGLLLLPVLAIGVVAWVVLAIIAAVKAGNGELYRYPLTIRFVS